jgi:hypothetical protein
VFVISVFLILRASSFSFWVARMKTAKRLEYYQALGLQPTSSSDHNPFNSSISSNSTPVFWVTEYILGRLLRGSKLEDGNRYQVRLTSGFLSKLSLFLRARGSVYVWMLGLGLLKASHRVL